MTDRQVRVYLDGDLQDYDVSMQPDFTCSIYANGRLDEIADVEVYADTCVPNAMGDGMFENGITLSVPAPKDGRDAAVVVWASRATSEFHEILEFTKLNGKSIARAHPVEEYEMWKWLYAKMYALANEYVERYPMGEQDEV